MQVGLLNVDGYYNSLLSFIDKAVDEGFIAPSARQIILSAPTAHELMSKLEVQLPHAQCAIALIAFVSQLHTCLSHYRDAPYYYY